MVRLGIHLTALSFECCFMCFFSVNVAFVQMLCVRRAVVKMVLHGKKRDFFCEFVYRRLRTMGWAIGLGSISDGTRTSRTVSSSRSSILPWEVSNGSPT